ncbi:MAG: NAD(P)-dependent oxidoreductase, partial [Actinomycetota bacterium]
IESILVHFSTDYVFDGEKGDPYTIADKPNPINTYGRSKLLGGSFLANLGYPKYYLIRTSWVFGNSINSFTTKLIEWMSKNSQLRIVDDQISSPTYARDLAYITLKLLETGNYGLYHISNSEFCSRYEWAEFIASKLGWKGKIEPAKSKEFNSPAKRPKFSALDIFPIDEILGISISSWKDATLRYLHFEVLS